MADRAETFEIRREFDDIRQRYKYLKGQPGLAEIDDELLTLGAQMSHESRDLAETFSDRRVARVRENLQQRKEDAAALEDRLEKIKTETVGLERLKEDLGISDQELADRIISLQSTLTELQLPEAANDDPDDVYISMRKQN